jgi:PTH1 family peptidyl-tRNA hydrolase
LSKPIRLLVGLGNPEPRDAHTRHNAGFWFADAVAARWGGSFRSQSNVFGDVADCQVGGERVRLLKPMTYMNRSGRAVAAMANFYKFEIDEILVAHDDIDLPPGTVRLKRGGGHGGHNGLRDVIPQLVPRHRRRQVPDRHEPVAPEARGRRARERRLSRPHGLQMRHRRPPQRRQIDAL